MGTMTITPAHLDVGTIELDLASIFGGIGAYLDDAFEHEIENFTEYVEGITFETYDWTDIAIDFEGAFQDFARKYFVDVIKENYSDLFDSGAIELGNVTFARSNDPMMFGIETILCEATVNAEKLWDLLDGVAEVWDGHDRSGFIRTCDDNRWAVRQAIEVWLENNPRLTDTWSLAILEYMNSDCWLEEYIEYPEEAIKAYTEN